AGACALVSCGPDCTVTGEGIAANGAFARRDFAIHDIRTADDLPAAFEAGAREQAEGLLTTAESIFVAQRARVSELAARYRLPAMYPYSIQVTDAGGLMAYDVNYPDLERRAAAYVNKILKGAKSSDLPVQQPTKFALVINLKTAKTLG